MAIRIRVEEEGASRSLSPIHRGPECVGVGHLQLRGCGSGLLSDIRQGGRFLLACGHEVTFLHII